MLNDEFRRLVIVKIVDLDRCSRDICVWNLFTQKMLNGCY